MSDESVMSSRLRDHTEITQAEGRDDTHHGSTLGTDPSEMAALREGRQAVVRRQGRVEEN